MVIKFRAWDKEEKVMLHWHENKDAICEAIPRDCGDEWTERCIVMQFTGVLDINGKEIYEGDIIIHKINNTAYVGGVTLSRKRIVRWNGIYCGYLSLKDSDDSRISFEIIGNIYENPELTGD